MSAPHESQLTFNIVWNKDAFSHLRPFTRSLLHHSTCRYRFVANGCWPESLDELRAFQRLHPDRIVEVLVTSDEVVAHGVALDAVLRSRDDGDQFCLMDPDIKANAPFVQDLTRHLADNAAVSSATEVWSINSVLPPNYPGVAGEFYFDQDGFVFGGPHLAIYDRATLDQVLDEYGVGLGSAGPEVQDNARIELASMRPNLKIFDTGKIVNILLQAQGHQVIHEDLAQIVHIGGLSHYLAPTRFQKDASGETVPDWALMDKDGTRHEVTRFTAGVMRELAAGRPPPPTPPGVEASMADRLETARAEVIDLIERYGDQRNPAR